MSNFFRGLKAAGNGIQMAFGWGAYSGARPSRDRKQQAWNRSAPGDEEVNLTEYDRNNLTLEDYDVYRNNEIGRSIVDRLTTYTVGPYGIMPRAQTTDKEWNKSADIFFERVIAKDIDYRRRSWFQWQPYQKTTLGAAIMAADCGHIMRSDGRLQPVESDMITAPADEAKNPRIRQGIQLDAEGVVLGFWVCGRNENGRVDKTKGTFIDRQDFIYCPYPMFRFSQLRGANGLSACIEAIRDYDETSNYVRGKVKHDGMQHLKVKSPDGDLTNGLPYRTQTDATTGSKRRVIQQDGAQIWELAAGEDVDTFDSRTPNAQYVGFMEAQLKTIAAANGIPYEYLMQIFVQGSFSAQRAAWRGMHDTVERWQEWLNSLFNQRVWNWSIARAMKAGRVPKAPMYEVDGSSQWWWVDWSKPPMLGIDEGAEIAAARDAWNLGHRSLKKSIADIGGNRDDVFEEKMDDISSAIEISDRLNKLHPGANTTWRDVINAATSVSQNLTPIEPDAGQLDSAASGKEPAQ